MLANSIQPLLLRVSELLVSHNLLEGVLHPFFGSVERFFFTRRVFDHRDDIDERFVVANLVRLLQIVHREAFGRGIQLLTEFSERLCTPSLRTIEQNLGRALDWPSGLPSRVEAALWLAQELDI